VTRKAGNQAQTLYTVCANIQYLPIVPAVQGYNACIIAYGQTGTGKTHTMDGEGSGRERGIIPRAIEDIYAHIENDSAAHSKFLVRASYFQIYNEVRQHLKAYILVQSTLVKRGFIKHDATFRLKQHPPYQLAGYPPCR
jgi:hypothetical protein